MYAESVIRYNFYIDNMPTDDIAMLDNEQKNRLLTLAANTAQLQKANNNPESNPILQEANLDFARTMNKIIFDKHVNEAGKELIIKNLNMPPPSESR